MSTPRSTKFNTNTSSSNPNRKPSSSTQRTTQSNTSTSGHQNQSTRSTRGTNSGPPEKTEEQKLAETQRLNADLDALDDKFQPSFPKKSRFAHEGLNHKKYGIGGSSSPGRKVVERIGRIIEGERKGGSGSESVNGGGRK
ncbi:067836e5-a488-4752-8e00-253fe72dcb15 [Sclerotinia trifoliorum]|uniref:067836e5-a488-4752-8e00-253fe72dcb15 n=1 Tax=Sclerotinia trifoliorum TaxID=28548 RepID=A0A8H2VTJ0_9HELO|nr:067836e5-a488-4752-8e00-253fe72dcb15 [Sclerotinia trifoliorum]